MDTAERLRLGARVCKLVFGRLDPSASAVLSIAVHDLDAAGYPSHAITQILDTRCREVILDLKTAFGGALVDPHAAAILVLHSVQAGLHRSAARPSRQPAPPPTPATTTPPAPAEPAPRAQEPEVTRRPYTPPPTTTDDAPAAKAPKKKSEPKPKE